MKKLTFGLMGFAALSLAVATLFTSCKKDEVKELASISATINGENFSATAVAKQDNSNAKLADLLAGNGDKITSIYGANASGQVLSIVLNGNTEATYDLSLDVKLNPTTLLINYLTTGDIEDTAKDAISATANTMMVYKKSESLQDVKSKDFYVATKASVIINKIPTVGVVKYYKGTFTATLENANGEKLEVTNGKFSCPGK